jgi:hypothetical protein
MNRDVLSTVSETAKMTDKNGWWNVMTFYLLCSDSGVKLSVASDLWIGMW